jgi:hypothetical protein
MNKIAGLMQREWLQHRTAWLLLAGIPLGLGLLLVGFAQLEIDSPLDSELGAALPAVMATGTIFGSTVLLAALVWLSSLFMATGLPRRDHGDRSIEFWLSLPVGHVPSLGVPLLVHLLLVPMVALAIGLLGGWLLSLVMVSRFVGIGAWFGLPWGEIASASLSLVLRLAAGLPLATLWLAPLIGLALLAKALAGRWGLPVLVVGLAITSALLDEVFGITLLAQWLAELFRNLGLSLLGASGQSMVIQGGESDALQALGALPAWAFSDWLAALRNLASPLMPLGLLIAAGCFVALVQWRQRRGGVAG